jgi:hypothetical protein
MTTNPIAQRLQTLLDAQGIKLAEACRRAGGKFSLSLGKFLSCNLSFGKLTSPHQPGEAP